MKEVQANIPVQKCVTSELENMVRMVNDVNMVTDTIAMKLRGASPCEPCKTGNSPDGIVDLLDMIRNDLNIVLGKLDSINGTM